MTEGRLPSVVLLSALLTVGVSSVLNADTAPLRGKGVISVNLHRLSQDHTCPDADPLPEALATNEYVDAVSYHTYGKNREVSRCVVDTAMMRNHYGRPKIISSDGGLWTNADAWCWINTILDQGPPGGCPPAANPSHAEHYDHYEAFFTRPNCENAARQCPRRKRGRALIFPRWPGL